MTHGPDHVRATGDGGQDFTPPTAYTNKHTMDLQYCIECDAEREKIGIAAQDINGRMDLLIHTI